MLKSKISKQYFTVFKELYLCLGVRAGEGGLCVWSLRGPELAMHPEAINTGKRRMTPVAPDSQLDHGIHIPHRLLRERERGRDCGEQINLKPCKSDNLSLKNEMKLIINK